MTYEGLTSTLRWREGKPRDERSDYLIAFEVRHDGVVVNHGVTEAQIENGSWVYRGSGHEETVYLEDDEWKIVAYAELPDFPHAAIDAEFTDLVPEDNRIESL